MMTPTARRPAPPVSRGTHQRRITDQLLPLLTHGLPDDLGEALPEAVQVLGEEIDYLSGIIQSDSTRDDLKPRFTAKRHKLVVVRTLLARLARMEAPHGPSQG
jgi:hypothetical protein